MDESPTPRAPQAPPLASAEERGPGGEAHARRVRRFARREWRLLMMWLMLACAMACAGAQALAWLAPVHSIGDYGDYISFKIAMWRASPDSMTYTETDDAGHTLFRYTTSNPDLVKQWFAYVNDETPIMYAECGHTLNEPPPTHNAYVFSQHGAPIETAKGDSGGYYCDFYTLSGGSSRNPFQYFLSNPHASPNPPPVGHQEIP